MKRIFGLFIIVVSTVLANPIDTSPKISEVQIIDGDNWKIEINIDSHFMNDLDSIYLEGEYGRSKVLSFDTTECYQVIQQENMSNELQFLRTQDHIRLYLFYKTYHDTDDVKIGEYPGSYLKNIRPEQSIARAMGESEFYKDNTPGFGFYNTPDDCMAKIYGHFFDKNGQPIRDIYFRFYNIMWKPYEYIDSSGFYQAEKPSRSYYYDAFMLHAYGETEEKWDFQPAEFDLEPGDSLEVNFHSLQTAVVPVIKNTIMFSNYPHPASGYTWFILDAEGVDPSALRIDVYDLRGRRVDSFRPRALKSRYDCSHLPRGSYFMSLRSGKQILATKKLQILK